MDFESVWGPRCSSEGRADREAIAALEDVLEANNRKLIGRPSIIETRQISSTTYQSLAECRSRPAIRGR